MSTIYTVFTTKYQGYGTKNYQDSHHAQENMKFATQISPLLNYYCYQQNHEQKWKLPKFARQWN